MAFTAIGLGAVAVSGYSAYQSKRAGDQALNLASDQASRQSYYDQQLRNLIANPNKIFDDPGYKESFDQGLQAVERSAAARGFLGSGNAATELMTFGQSFASRYLREQEQLLASLSGAQFNPASAMATGQQSYDSSFIQLGQSLASLGYTFGGMRTGGSGGSSGSSFMGMPESSVPGTYVSDGGYIVNMPGG